MVPKNSSLYKIICHKVPLYRISSIYWKYYLAVKLTQSNQYVLSLHETWGNVVSPGSRQGSDASPGGLLLLPVTWLGYELGGAQTVRGIGWIDSHGFLSFILTVNFPFDGWGTWDSDRWGESFKAISIQVALPPKEPVYYTSFFLLPYLRWKYSP